MPKTKAKDKIQLSTGEVMTLGEALERGLVRKRAVDDNNGFTEDLGKAKRFVAQETGGSGLGWDIGKTLFHGKFTR